MKKYLLALAAAALLTAGCTSSGAATPTPFVITSTLPPASQPGSDATAQPATAPPAPASSRVTEGRTTARVFVRPEPSTAGTPLGTIGPDSPLLIIARDAGGNWYQILLDPQANTTGWVAAQYVEVRDRNAIPIFGTAAGQGGVVLQQINVRSGPGTDFDSLGILNPRDAVTLTAKNPDGRWLQILFSTGPDGKGWVMASYVQANGAESLPVISQSGDLVGTETPTPAPPTVTPTLVPAPADNDSSQAPGANVILSPSGARSLIYSSDVSSPEGDSEDWVGFTPYTAGVTASLECIGNGTVRVDLWQNGAPLQDWGSLACGSRNSRLSLTPGAPAMIRVQAVSSTGGLACIHYTLTIRTLP